MYIERPDDSYVQRLIALLGSDHDIPEWEIVRFDLLIKYDLFRIMQRFVGDEVDEATVWYITGMVKPGLFAINMLDVSRVRTYSKNPGDGRYMGFVNKVNETKHG